MSGSVYEMQRAFDKQVGRPPFSGQNLQIVLSKLTEAFSWGCTDAEACLHANISPAALYRMQEKIKGFREQKELLKNDPVLKIRANLIKEATKDGNLGLKVLERIKKDEFALKTNVDLTSLGQRLGVVVMPVENNTMVLDGELINPSENKQIEASSPLDALEDGSGS